MHLLITEFDGPEVIDRTLRSVPRNPLHLSEPVWPSGKALGWYAEGPRFESASALLSLQNLWSVDNVL